MSAENIEWAHLKDLSKIAQEQAETKANPKIIVFSSVYVGLGWVALFDQNNRLLKENDRPRSGAYVIFTIVTNFKKTFEDEERSEYLVKPSLNHDSLGCVGVIIHPSLPNEEIVCVGLNQNFWTLEKVAVFNSAILNSDPRKLEELEWKSV